MLHSFCFPIFFSPISSVLFYPAFLYTFYSPSHSHLLSPVRLFRTKDETIRRTHEISGRRSTKRAAQTEQWCVDVGEIR